MLGVSGSRPPLAAAVEAFVEPGAAHLAAALGHVHRHVGAAQHLGRRHALVRGRSGKADACADRDVEVIERERGAELFQQRAAQPFEDRARDLARHDRGEFIPAQPVGARFGAADFAQQPCALLDQLVADRVAIVVVDLLETVQIDHRQRHFLVPARDAQDVLMQGMAVGKAGERVDIGALFKPADRGDAAAAEEEQGGGVDQDRADQQRRLGRQLPAARPRDRHGQHSGHDARNDDRDDHQSGRGQAQGVLHREQGAGFPIEGRARGRAVA